MTGQIALSVDANAGRGRILLRSFLFSANDQSSSNHKSFWGTGNHDRGKIFFFLFS